MAQTKIELAEKNREWRIANRDKVLASKLRYREKRREELAEKAREYHASVPKTAEQKARGLERYRKLWAKRTPEQVAASQARVKAYRRPPLTDAQKARKIENDRVWKAANPESVKAVAHKRRLANGEMAATKDEVAAILSSGLCAACGSQDNIELDHIVPLARGGSGAASNLQPLCMSCNRSKGAKLMSEWNGRKLR